MMMKIINIIVLCIAAALCAISCDKTELDNISPTSPETEGQVVLYASINNPALTKVSYEDNGEQGIGIEWQVGDAFTIYNYPIFSTSDGERDTSRVGDFTCVSVDDAGVGKFVLEDGVTLADSSVYMTYYPATTADDLMSNDLFDDIESRLTVQNGDDISNLDNACYMNTMFIYTNGAIAGYDLVSVDDDFNTTADGSLMFIHNTAIMTITFKSDVRPAKLVFENGDDDTYTVTYSTIEPDAVTGLYTSHIAINECTSGTRTLRFSLYASADSTEPYDVREVETSKDYYVGMRYTAPISDLSNAVWAGAGTEDDPYQISTVEDFDNMRDLATYYNYYENTYFELTQSIDMGGIDGDGNGIETATFTPIAYFNGVFDGGDNTLSGIYIPSSSTFRQGVFGTTTGATMKNLSVTNSLLLAATDYSGAIAGSADYSSSIINCHNSATIVGNKYVGGIVGHGCISATIENCTNQGDVSGYAYVGGVAGRIYNESIVDNCINTASRIYAYQYVGGVIGEVTTDSHAINSYSIGAVESSSYVIGGFVGQIIANSSVVNCYAHGSVTNTDASIGGFAGKISSSSVINNCYTTATVSTTSLTEVGMFIGMNDGADTNPTTKCYYLADESGYPSVGRYVNDAVDDITEISSDMLASDTFAAKLDAQAYNYNLTKPAINALAWKSSDEDYPVFNSEASPVMGSLFAGSGTETDPYQISTAADLRTLSSDVISGITYSGCYLQLTDEIDLGGIDENGAGVAGAEFTPIGNAYSAFRGTLDGDDNAIKGLYINRAGTAFTALFYTTVGATIKNISLYGSVTGANYTAGFVGSADECSTIINCHNYATIVGGQYVGGIAGHSNGTATLDSCSNSANISASVANSGGVTGRLNSYGTVVNCVNTGDVIGVNYSGGVVGALVDNSSLSYSYNTGSVSGKASVGGVAGYAGASGVAYCYNLGVVKTTELVENSAGGIVGLLDGGATLSDSYNEGEVAAHCFVGGILGRTNGDNIISNCYNRGNVTATGYDAAGGVGRLYDLSTVENCYSTAVISASDSSTNIGMFVGDFEAAEASITNCYYLASSGDVYKPVGSSDDTTLVTAMSSDEMQHEDFVTSLGDTIWGMDSSSKNDGFPIFFWQ